MDKKLSNSQLKNRILGNCKNASSEVRKSLESYMKSASRSDLEILLKKVKISHGINLRFEL